MAFLDWKLCTMKLLCVALAFGLACHLVTATLSKTDAKKSASKALEEKVGGLVVCFFFVVSHTSSDLASLGRY